VQFSAMPAQASAKPNGNAPETVECDIPGRRRFIIWNSEFEVDEKYEVRHLPVSCDLLAAA
jgi:hypothetical protein